MNGHTPDVAWDGQNEANTAEAVRIIVSIQANEIPPGTDPILDLIPILEGSGYKLVQNGVAGSERFLAFERAAPVATPASDVIRRDDVPVFGVQLGFAKRVLHEWLCHRG